MAGAEIPCQGRQGEGMCEPGVDGEEYTRFSVLETVTGKRRFHWLSSSSSVEDLSGLLTLSIHFKQDQRLQIHACGLCDCVIVDCVIV